MFDLIYANGDSFTAGTDTKAVNKLLYTYNGYKQNLKNVKKSKNEQQQLLDKSGSYVKHLESITGIPSVNAAIPGSGNTSIVLDTLKDLETYKQKYNNMLCLVNITDCNRLWYPNYKNTANIATHKPGSKTEEEFCKTVVLNSDRKTWSMISIIQYLGLINYCKLNNIVLYFIGGPLFNMDTIEENALWQDIYDMTVDFIGGQDIHLMKNELIWTQTGHLPEKFHIELADRLAGMLKI